MNTKQLGSGVRGDHIAELGLFPWHVRIIDYSRNGALNRCSGTLISDEWIVTTASCIMS